MKLTLKITIFCWITLAGCLLKQRAPTLPSFTLLGIDSSKIFSTANIHKGKATILVYFSPDCEHCQQETEDWIKHINQFKNAQFIYITNDPLERLKLFNEIYKIYQYPNMQLGRDHEFYFLREYKPTGTPYIVVYNKNKELRAVLPGGAKSEKLLAIIKNINN